MEHQICDLWLSESRGNAKWGSSMLVISGIWKKNRGCLNFSRFMIAGIGACAFKVSYLDFVFKSETKKFGLQHKSRLNRPRNTRNNHYSGKSDCKSSRMNYFIAFQYIWGQFKISHTLPFMTVGSLGYLCAGFRDLSSCYCGVCL